MGIRDTVYAVRKKYNLPLTQADVHLAKSVLENMKEKYGDELELDDEYESWIVEAGLTHRYLGVTTEDLEWVDEWFPTVSMSAWVKIVVSHILQTLGEDLSLTSRIVSKISKVMEEHKFKRQNHYVSSMVNMLLGKTKPLYGLKPLQTKYVLKLHTEPIETSQPQQKLNIPRLRLSIVQRLHRGLQRTHLTDKTIDKYLVVLGRIGSDSAYGETYAVCVRGKDNKCKGFWTRKSLHLALKLQTANSRKEAQKLWNEMHFLRWGQQMVARGICINFPLVYRLVIMPNVVTENKDLITRRGALTLGILNELANGDFSHWLKHTTFGYNNLGKFLLQGFMALYVVQNLWKSYHNDLHAGNFLYNELEKGKRFVYDVVGRGRFVINNCNFLVKLWDFGEMNTHKEKNAFEDVEKVFTSLNEILLKQRKRMYTQTMRQWVRRLASLTDVWVVMQEIAKVSRDITFVPWSRANKSKKPKTLYYSRIDKFDHKPVHNIRPLMTRSPLNWADDFRRLK